MATLDAVSPHRLLPLLLALPSGAIVGVPADLTDGHPLHESDLAAFGPCLQTDREVRYAATRVPARALLDLSGLTVPLVAAALPALSGGGAAVVLHSRDCGLLARLGERVLHQAGSRWRWRPSESIRAKRMLELRIEEAPAGRIQWVRFALDGTQGPEAVLSAVRAGGVRVCESRITYGASFAR
ncbi:MAG: hypothetical protein E4H41_04445 [Gemmatimonadales bacterium]|jgi:hypothetical protein|nr:MAG: hypothetical protein E4H41_04445 [Gemmatimonadales bacterium]